MRSSGDQLTRSEGDISGTTGLSASSLLKLLIRHFASSSPLIKSAISFDMLFESFLIDSCSVADRRHRVGVFRKLLTARIGSGDKDRPLWSTFITLLIPLFWREVILIGSFRFPKINQVVDRTHELHVRTHSLKCNDVQFGLFLAYRKLRR